ncbi:MAG: tetratricopeptide repeat protein [Acidobacteria bacterium]|nr:tetratricopeptide repeat protein [Acidobacteriota bacterium]
MLYFLFFCSGVSGLIYQVVWVRAFGTVFGNTIYSASIVIAVFMLGLGVGSYVVGRWADRRYTNRSDSLLRIFGSFELTIGALAVGVSLLLPHLGDVAASISSYERGWDGWYTLSATSYVARGALAVALLTPITLLMGGTLTLLIRHLVRHDLDAGPGRIALLYGVNTAGAAGGCLLTDLALVPAVGLQRTQLAAFALNVIAGVGAFALASLVRPKPDTTIPKSQGVRRIRLQPDRVRGVRLQPDQDSRSVPWTALAIALSGFAAMGMEIVWFRHFSMLLGEYRAVFSVLLAIILGGIGVGSLAGGWLAGRGASPAHPWIGAQALFVLSTLIGFTLVDARDLSDAARAASTAQAAVEGWRRAFAELWFNARPMLLVVALPALLMGVAFPLGNAIVQRAEPSVGRRAGLLYLSNTAGAVGGSLVAGFFLLPVLGLQSSVTTLVAIAAAAVVPLHIATAGGRRPYVSATALAVAGVALGAWLLLPGDYLIAKGLLFPPDKAYELSEGLMEVIAVTDGPNGGRVLVTNGHPMSSTELFSQRYMRAMAHIPLLAHGNPRRVLVLCYGVGNTAHAVSLHPSVERIEVVDLSRHVLEHSGYFEEFNRGVLRDARVAVYINDGRHHLRMQPAGSYDLITLEPPPVVHAGVAALYSREFYASARSRLSPKGVISQWLPVFGVSNDVVLSMTRAFVDVFPNTVLLSGANMNLLLVGTNDVRTDIDPARVAEALARAPAVQADLQRLDLGSLREIVGTFVAPAGVLAAATRAAAPVTDDRPLQEYGKRSLVDFGEGGIPSSLIAIGHVAEWCPGCFRDGKPSPPVAGLDAYLALAELAYRAPTDRSRATPPTPGRVVAGSGYLGSIVPDAPELPKLVAMLEKRPAEAVSGAYVAAEPVEARYTRATTLLEAGRFREAIDELRLVVEQAPDAVEARNNLGVALASVGRLDEAIEQFRQALAIRPGFADAQRNLALAREKRKLVGSR